MQASMLLNTYTGMHAMADSQFWVTRGTSSLRLRPRSPFRRMSAARSTARRSGRISVQAAGLADQIDTALKQSEAEGLKQLRQLKADGKLRGFGSARQVPKRIYTLEEMRLNKVEPTALLSPTDDTLNGVRQVIQAGTIAAVLGAYFALGLGPDQLIGLLVAVTFLYFADQVANGGGLQALALDSIARVLNGTYPERVALHEAGHFLVAYLLGTAPREYTLSALDAFQRWAPKAISPVHNVSLYRRNAGVPVVYLLGKLLRKCMLSVLDAFWRYRALNVQAGTQFCDSEFQREVASGRLSSSSLDAFSCIALAGVATEYLRFGKAEGGLGDVAMLDNMLKGLQFSQKKADGEVRWAVLNAVALLRQHAKAHDALAEAMRRGMSVGACIEQLEAALNVEELAPASALSQ